MKVVCLWSGGKDSCFACYKAISSGYEVAALVNFTRAGAHTSVSHGISSEVILKQAGCVGIPVVQNPMPQKTYRNEFKKLITELKGTKKIRGIVFGDIYLEVHKEWIDKVCLELEVEAILPLWNRDTKELALEIVNSGFEAVIVSVKAGILGEEWLGKKIDREFIKGLNSRIDPCGEKGEFHTFAYNGPLFKKPLKFATGKKIRRDNHWFLEVLP